MLDPEMQALVNQIRTDNPQLDEATATAVAFDLAGDLVDVLQAWSRGRRQALASLQSYTQDWDQQAVCHRVAARAYVGGRKLTTLTVPFARLVAVLGQPHQKDQPDYPDDRESTDVCWCVRSTVNPAYRVTIWNYGNGPACNGDPVEQITEYSVYYTDFEFWAQLADLLLERKERTHAA